MAKNKKQKRSKKLKGEVFSQKSRKHKLLNSIRKFDDPVLYEKCSDVEGKEESSTLFKKLKNVLRETNDGVGLAAPQIGELKNALVHTAGLGGEIYFMCNPKIVERSEEQEIANEGCLSYPGFGVPINRNKWITVKYKDEDFVDHQRKFEDYHARVIQHEIDHIFDGNCIIGEAYLKYKATGKLTNDPTEVLIEPVT